MSIRIDWNKLKSAHERLKGNINPNDEVTFIMVMRGHAVKKAIIKFKNFLDFFWKISEDPMQDVINLAVQNSEGHIIYRHRHITAGNEEIPIGGNSNIILNWNTFMSGRKDTLVRITVAQINGYEK